MSQKTPPCTWTEAGWMTPEHRIGCRDADCQGCRPCPESHCELHGRCPNHVERGAGIFTCPRCIGKVKRTVREIGTRYAELPDEYEFAGVDSEVLNMHGPAADPSVWAERRRRLVEVYAERGWCDYPRHGALAPDDEQHPYAVLSRWDQAIRESYGPQTDLFVTVSSAVTYLTGEVMDRFAHTQEFEDFARETRACLSHLEDVLALSARPETGAPCPACTEELAKRRMHCPDDSCDECRERAPRLVKRLAEHHPRIKPAKVCAVANCRTCAGDNDSWHCPRDPAHHWDNVSYRGRVDREYVDHADTLTADQAAERFGIKASVIRVWGSRELVRKVGKDANGITLYAVEDIASRVEVSA